MTLDLCPLLFDSEVGGFSARLMLGVALLGLALSKLFSSDAVRIPESAPPDAKVPDLFGIFSLSFGFKSPSETGGV